MSFWSLRFPLDYCFSGVFLWLFLVGLSVLLRGLSLRPSHRLLLLNSWLYEGSLNRFNLQWPLGPLLRKRLRLRCDDTWLLLHPQPFHLCRLFLLSKVSKRPSFLFFTFSSLILTFLPVLLQHEKSCFLWTHSNIRLLAFVYFPSPTPYLSGTSRPSLFLPLLTKINKKKIGTN